MVYYASQHGAGTANTRAAIAALKPFKSSGALSATDSPAWDGRLSGRALETFHADRNAIDYAVYSYGTPIAWHTPAGWTIVATKFSASTGRHQSLTRQGIGYDTPAVSVN